MKITLEKAREAKCPVCGKKMIYLLQNEINYRAGSSVHSFSCICGVKWTAWDLKITGLGKVYTDKRAKTIKKKFEEFKNKKEN